MDVEACRAQADPEVVRRANLLDGLATWLRAECGGYEEDDGGDVARRVQNGALNECLDDALANDSLSDDATCPLTDDALRVYSAARERARLSLRAWLDRFDTDSLARVREAVLARQKREAQEVADAPARAAAYAVQCAEEDARDAAVDRAEAVAREEGAKKALAEAQANASMPTNA